MNHALRSWAPGALLLAVAVTLAACGREDASPHPFPSSAATACSEDSSLATGLCPLAAHRQDAVLAATDTPSMADLLGWAEASYPQYFPGPRTDLLFSSPYFYRYYPTAGNYIGFAGNSVYILGPVSDGALQYVGELNDFSNQVANWKSQVCQPGVTSGYAGGYTDTGGAGGGDGGGDGAAGDGGYFVNTPVVVELADGTILGSAQTDPVKGMVTICGGRTGQPVKITFMGAAGAQYFDEARNQLVPFPSGESMTVVVPQIERNIGATAFTEAAYQYMVAHYGADGWRNPDNVRAANDAVQQEINRSLRDTLAVDDITRLTIAYRGAATGTIDTSQNGIYSMVNSGFAFAAGEYNTTVSNPATEARKQLAQDLTDGHIDGYTSAGARVVGATGQMYDPASVRERWLEGANRLTQKFGDANAQQAANQTTRITAWMWRWVPNAYGFLSCDGTPDSSLNPCWCPPTSADVYPGRYSLDAAGQVTIEFPAECGRAPQRLDLPGATSQMFYGDDAVFFLLNDGRVFGMGNNTNGSLGMHDRLPRFVPNPLTGITGVVSMYPSSGTVVAVTSTGDAYAWGDYNFSHGGSPLTADYVPEKISGLPRVVQAITAGSVIAALGVDGRVYTFGLFNSFALFGDSTPPEAQSSQRVPTAIPSLTDVVMLATAEPTAHQWWPPQSFLAMRRDGSIWAWGYNDIDLLGTGTALDSNFSPDPRAYLPYPTQVQGLTGQHPRQIGIAGGLGSYALMDDGSIWRWGKSVFLPALSSSTQKIPFPQGVTGYKSLLPGLGAVALTNDGRLYDFIFNQFLSAPVIGTGAAASLGVEGTTRYR